MHACAGRAPWRRGVSRAWLSWLAMCAFSLALVQPAAAQAPKEYDLKAVLLYNFTQFVEWPPSTMPAADSPFIIGVLGTDPFGRALEETVRHESVGTHRIVVERFSRVENARGCHILFISASERENLGPILSALDGRPVLTVGDLDDFAARGGMVHMYRNAENKIRLRINLAAVKNNQLQMSAKLLRVAEVLPAKRE
jgi:hypothetical protein